MHQLTCPCVIGINIGYFELIRCKPWVFYDQVYLRKLCIQNLLFYAALIGFAAQYSCSLSCCYVSMCIALLLLLSFSLFLAAALKEAMSIRIGSAYVITSVHLS